MSQDDKDTESEKSTASDSDKIGRSESRTPSPVSESIPQAFAFYQHRLAAYEERYGSPSQPKSIIISSKEWSRFVDDGYFLEPDKEHPTRVNFDKILSFLSVLYPHYLKDIRNTLEGDNPASLLRPDKNGEPSYSLYGIFFAIKKNRDTEIATMKEEICKFYTDNLDHALFSSDSFKDKDTFKRYLRDYLDDKTLSKEEEKNREKFLEKLHIEHTFKYYGNDAREQIAAREKDNQASLKTLKKAINGVARELEQPQPARLTAYDPAKQRKTNAYHLIKAGEEDKYKKHFKEKEDKRKEKAATNNSRAITLNKYLYPLWRSSTAFVSFWSTVCLMKGWNLIPTELNLILAMLGVFALIFVSNYYSNWSLARDSTRDFLKELKTVYKDEKKLSPLKKAVTVFITLGVMSIYGGPFCYAIVYKLYPQLGGLEWPYWVAGGVCGLIFSVQACIIFGPKIAKYCREFSFDNTQKFLSKELAEPWNAGKYGTAIWKAVAMTLSLGLVGFGNWATFGGLGNSMRSVTGALDPYISEVGGMIHNHAIMLSTFFLIAIFNTIGSWIFTGEKLYQFFGSYLPNSGLGKKISSGDPRIIKVRELTQFKHNRSPENNNCAGVQVDESSVTFWDRADKVTRVESSFVANAATVMLENMQAITEMITGIFKSLPPSTVSMLNKWEQVTKAGMLSAPPQSTIPEDTYKYCNKALRNPDKKLDKPHRADTPMLQEIPQQLDLGLPPAEPRRPSTLTASNGIGHASIPNLHRLVVPASPGKPSTSSSDDLRQDPLGAAVIRTSTQGSLVAARQLNNSNWDSFNLTGAVTPTGQRSNSTSFNRTTSPSTLATSQSNIS